VLEPVVPDSTPVPVRGRRLNMIGGRVLRRVLDRAVRAALADHLPSLPEDRIRSICSEVRRQHGELVERHARAIRAMPRRAYIVELERSRGAMLAERDRLREELDGMRQKLDVSRTMLLEEQRHFAERAAETDLALDAELGAELAGVLADESLGEAARRRRLVEIATEAVHRARQRAFDERVTEHQRRIELFERRIAKLKGSLERTESELARLAALKPGDAGLASIYRSVQGLSGDDAHFAAKQELLEEIFQANLMLRRAVGEQRAGA
jgi:hypothetical protein